MRNPSTYVAQSTCVSSLNTSSKLSSEAQVYVVYVVYTCVGINDFDDVFNDETHVDCTA